MAYAGYVPAKLPPGKPTDFQAALWSIKSNDSLEVLQKLSYNTAIAPTEDKFRKVKVSNGKIKATIVDVPGAVETLKLMGWEDAVEEGDALLVLPKGRSIKMADVRAIQEAQERLKKDAKAMSRSQSASSLKSSSSEKELLRQQLEADRLERAAREPVTKGSSAQALPAADGPRIAGAKDAGFKNGCGC